MKVIIVSILIIATSFYLFPFEFTFLPSGLNTKLMMSVLGLFYMLKHGLKMSGIYISKEILISSFIAIVFSLVCLISLEYNQTSDFAYASYIISMWIWFAAAYAVVSLIAEYYNKISVKLIVNYLIIVCVVQCVLAMLIEYIPIVKLFVDSTMTIGVTQMLNDNNRLYGIGAALDVAGGRFAAVLIMIIILVTKDSEIYSSRKLLALYFIAYIIIAFIGNLIARTTTVGILVSLAYLILNLGILNLKIKISSLRIWQVLLIVLSILLPIVIFLYNSQESFYELIRYGFEGFFNWVEKGEWETGSTEKLKTMYVYPESLKTWIIGDGYFDNPSGHGFYMDTDVGYLRFIFYCGLSGLTVFILFFIYLTISMCLNFKKYTHLFLLLFLFLLINWLKVSTDMFIIYALFLSISSPYINNNFYLKVPN